MKRHFLLPVLALICALLLCACGAGSTGDAASTAAPTETSRRLELHSRLAAVWVGTAADQGETDRVETLTIRDDFTFQARLDRDGKPLAETSGTYLVRGTTITFTTSGGAMRVYTYELDGNMLTLSAEDRTVTYRRSD